MRDLGKIKWQLTAAAILGIILSSSLSVFAQFYYVCSYAEPRGETEAQLAIVDLASKTIESIRGVPLAGQISTKKPIRLPIPRNEIYLIFASNGGPAKNSIVGNQMTTNFAAFDENMNLVNTGALPDVWIFDFVTAYSDTPFVQYTDFSGQLSVKRKAAISLRDLRPQISPRVRLPNEGLLPDTLGPFKSYQQIHRNDFHYFWCLNENGIYILSYDLDQRLLADSLRVASGLEYAYIFGASPADSLIYAFHINYNIIGGPESLRKSSIEPSFVKKFNMSDFSLADSIAVIMPSPDSDYVMAENGSCDNIGPYLVYFFFQGEDYRYFSPAMLFIFDTRTNEATWLRVGWR
jgi:hypothetical protein